MLNVYKNETDWVVAESKEDASKVWCETSGAEFFDENWQGEWEMMDPASTISIIDDEGKKVTKTCQEWIAENGRGFLCSTEW